MKKVFVLFAMALLTISFGCKEEIIKVIILPSEEPSIMGTWDWFGSRGGYIELTPEIAGYTIAYIFDSTGVFFRYINDTLDLQTSYRFVRDTVFVKPTGNDTINLLYIGQQDREGFGGTFIVTFICLDTLDIETGGVESTALKFKRRK